MAQKRIAKPNDIRWPGPEGLPRAFEDINANFDALFKALEGAGISPAGVISPPGPTGGGGTGTPPGLSDPVTESHGGTGKTTYSKGDLIVGKADHKLDVFAVGADGTVLTVVSGTPGWVAHPAAVLLQSSTPGTAQTGHANITGTFLASQIGVGTTAPNVTLDVRGAVNFVGGPSLPFQIDRTGAANTGRLRIFVGDGTAGSVTDENYVKSVNTGLHFLSGATGATEIVTFLVNGDVGVGTSPNARLDIGEASGSAEMLRFSYSPDSTYYHAISYLVHGADDTLNRIGFVLGDAAKAHATVMTIAGTKRVGIGTVVPANKLHVSGGEINVSGVMADVVPIPVIYFTDVNYPTTYRNVIKSEISAAAAQSRLTFGLSSGASTFAETMTITGIAVGVGTTAPISTLSVLKSSADSSEAQQGFTLYAGLTDTKLQMGAVTGAYSYIQSMQEATAWANRPLVLQPQGGYVGIGTINPNAPLTVVAPVANASGNALSVYLGVSATATGYYSWHGLFVSAAAVSIAEGKTNTGFWAGMRIDGFILDGDFKGTLTDQWAGWLRHGIYVAGGSGARTILSSVGLRVDTLKDAGTITNSFQLLLATPSGSGTISNEWGVYQESATASNYFGGKVGIGTSDPASLLDSRGDIRRSGANAQATVLSQATVQSGAMSGGTLTLANLIPAKSLVLGVTIHPTTAITSGDGGTTYSVGDGTDIDRFGASVLFAADVDLANITSAGPTYYSSAASLVLTCDGGKTFNAGVVRATVHYITLTPATS